MQVITMYFLAKVEEIKDARVKIRTSYHVIRLCSLKGLNTAPLFSFGICFGSGKKKRVHPKCRANNILIRYLFTGCQNKKKQCLD